MKSTEAINLIRRVMHRMAKEPLDKLFSMKFDSIDGVDEPFVVICDPRDGSVRVTQEAQ